MTNPQHTPPASWGLQEGDPISAELTALRRLGGGSAYDAYLAFDERCYAPVVVKLVRPDQVEDESTLRGLRREAAMLEAVRHPSVVRLLAQEPEGERPHLVLEHLDGPRLSSLIRRHGSLQSYQYLPLAIDVAAAIHYFAHEALVHLDIKPSNIIMGAPAKLIDLSVMRTTTDAAALSYPIGTDAYLAPEQADPPHTGEPGVASDVWGLGSTLFHAVAGYRPFPDGDPESADLVERFPQVALRAAELPDDVPDEVAKLIIAMLEKRPANRPRPAEVADTLQPVLEALPRGRLAGFKVR